MFKITVTAHFAAAHDLRGYEGPCEKLHGHNWLITATVGTDKLDAIGMAYDFKKLKSHLNEIVERLDHQYINEVPPFDQLNPTSENIARYIFESLASKLPPTVSVIAVEVGESEHNVASYEAT